jgi:acyl-CoA thioester hydrolase
MDYHTWIQNTEDQVCATITVDGAWMDTQLRKLANPVPQMATDAMNNIQRRVLLWFKRNFIF